MTDNALPLASPRVGQKPTPEEIADRIRLVLAAEGWMPGERYGSERQMAAELGVTRSQLRAALEILRADGVIRALIGRSGGIYVSDSRLERNLNASPNLPDIARVQGLRLTTRILDVALLPATARDQRVLHLGARERIYRLRRTREAGGAPLSIEENRLPERFFPGLEQYDLRELGKVAREVYQFHSGRADESLEIVPAHAPHNRLLGLAAGSPLVRIKRVSYQHSEVPTELAFEHFDAYRMRFHLHGYGFVGNVHRPLQT